MPQKDQSRIVRLSLQDARRLKRLSANHDMSISKAFHKYLGPELSKELTRSEADARRHEGPEKTSG
jgi:hypothetical protein